MRPADVHNLAQFHPRMEMFVYPVDRAGVVAFLHGYEYAAGGECQFTAALGKHLAGRHRVKPDALGWPGQIARLADRRGLTWLEAYLLAASEVLATHPESGAAPDGH